ncbi:MAG: extracellular catalytic domain type 1 short-chain-length polyhydroxyalkanoate depolymerase, partial [Chloroflexota bacterium]
MRESIPTRMVEAVHLTRAGQLAEATALIQRAIGGAPASAMRADDLASTDTTVESTYRLVSVDPVSGAAGTVSTRYDTPGAGPSEAEAPQEPPRHKPGIGLGFSSPISAGVRPAAVRAVVQRVLNRPVQGSNFPKISPSVAGLAPVPGMPAATLTDAEAGERFIAGTYVDPAGTRGYKLYVPSGYAGQAVALVVMLHGCSQTADDSAAGTRLNQLAEQVACLVVYPEQAASANPSRCWNWFQAAHQRRGDGEPSLIAGLTRQVMATYHVDLHRVYVAGMSAGGAMAAIMGVTYPDLYAAVGVHSGLASGAAHDLRSALAAMRRGRLTRPTDKSDGPRMDLPLIVFHGDRDATVHPRNGENLRTQALRLSASWRDPRFLLTQGQVPRG